MGINLLSFDKYIVTFSGGKDSTACFLYLLDQGVDKSKIELWHQEIDGRHEQFFDWEITPDYCRKFAEAFGVKIFFQWKQGGFKREMLRENSLTAPIFFENEDLTLGCAGGVRGTKSTRLKFPQVSASLTTRWCSAYLKINVCTMALTNQERFRGIKTLLLSGERGEESKQRSCYAVHEPDRADLRDGKSFTRHIDRFRPIKDWTEKEVWGIIEKYRIRVHPCYYMGWGRCSCKFCIFGNKNQFASAAKISPKQAEALIGYERQFDCTIKRKTDLGSLIKSGTPYAHITEELAGLATSLIYTPSIILKENQTWVLPAGAYGESCGPS